MSIRGNGCKVLNNLFSAFRLSSTRFATNIVQGQQKCTSAHDVRDKDALVLSLFPHVNPCSFCNGKDMGRIFISTLIAILLYNCIRV